MHRRGRDYLAWYRERHLPLIVEQRGMWIKYMDGTPDEDWNMGHMTHSLTNRRWKEKVVGYAESHDQAIVGDKTISMWLFDADIYTGMSKF